MGVLGRSRLVELVRAYRVIEPFEEANLDGDGYVLTVERKTTLNYLEHRNLVSHEIVFTPPSYVAHLTAKSRYGRMGLSFLNAAKVHSGFVGRLALELVNLSNDRTPITIMKGDPLMHIELITREGDPSPYTGSYQFQYMSDEEVEIYMDLLTREFKGLFEPGLLGRMAEQRVRE